MKIKIRVHCEVKYFAKRRNNQCFLRFYSLKSKGCKLYLIAHSRIHKKLVFIFFVHRTHHNQYSPMSKMEVAEDNEPSLSKVDVVLTFTLEVSLPLCIRHWHRIFFFVTPGFFSSL